MRSIQSRLTLGLILTLLLLLGGQWLVVDGMIRDVTERYALSRIQHDQESLLAALSFDADGRPVLNNPRINAAYQRPLSGHYYQLHAGETLLRSRSLWDAELADLPMNGGAPTHLRRPGPNAQRLLIAVRGFEKQGRKLTIAVAEDLSPLEEELHRFRGYFALLAVAVVTALIVLQRLVVRGALAPLERARREIGRLERGEITALDPAAPREIQPLVAEINRLLTVMNRRLSRSRNALGNLAHALKGPLTLLTQAADEAPAPLRDELRRHTATVGALLERELKRARLAGGGGGGQCLELGEALAPLIDTLRRIHREKSIAIEMRAPAAAAYPIDREDLMELAGNLLDNACKWARERVRLTVGEAPELTLTVEDDGPGCPDDRLALLTERGTRLDETPAGHGLGLAIVHDLVGDYGGSLEFATSGELGGLRVTVRLPGRP